MVLRKGRLVSTTMGVPGSKGEASYLPHGGLVLPVREGFTMFLL